MEKLPKLLMLLSSSRTYSVEEISERLEITQCTAYRHLCTIENAEFVPERNNGRYRLELDNVQGRDLEKPFHFSEEEEVYILYQGLGEIAGASLVKDRLLQKLHSLYNLKALNALKRDPFIENLKNLSRGTNDQRQAVLNRYRPSQNEEISDRTIELSTFTADYTFIWCFEACDHKNKPFKLSRMQNVELLSKPWCHQAEHRKPFTDTFKMSVDQPSAAVTVRLNLRAYNPLAEEFPVAQKHISIENNKYLLEVPVADYRGIGRFILGLLGEVEVRGPDGLKGFLKEKREKF